MSQASVGLYEGLFLLSQGASSDLLQCLDHVRQVLQNRGAKVVALRKWDDRKLAYPIKGQRRGVYLLGHFEAPAESLTQIDRDLNLSEIVLRNMILRADHIGEAELELVTREASERSVEADLRREEAPAAGASAGESSSVGDSNTVGESSSVSDSSTAGESSDDQQPAGEAGGDDGEGEPQTASAGDTDTISDQPQA